MVSVASKMQNENAVENRREITLEKNKRLSECLLWRMEKEYFEKKGINAWLQDVPYYITSNPFIAKAYAKVVIHFVRDWIAKHPEAKYHPFYVMELGTGPGQFSYLTVKALDELRREFGMDDVSIVYVMTDFAKANLEYYQSHPGLRMQVERGLLDFATHDMEKKTPIRLVNSKVELNQDTLVNPLTLFANYVFDTIANDSFTIHNGKLYELLVDLVTDESNLENNQPVELSKIDINRHVKEIQGSYYNDPELDAVLDLYKSSLRDTSFLIPIGSIRGLNHLRKLANGKIMLISSDKAYTEITEMENLGHPSLTIHGGCFSMMANCHAIGQYFKNCGGDFFKQTVRRGLKTCVYTAGFKLDSMPETRVAIKDHLEKFSPTDYFNVYRHMNESAATGELASIVSYLQLTEWDPRAYMRVSARVVAILEESDPESILVLAGNMHKIVENYYYMPNADCIHFEAGVFFHALKRYAEAVAYYQQAGQVLQNKFGIHYNLGICLHHLGRNSEALYSFKAALSLDPESQATKDWIEYLHKACAEQKNEFKRVSSMEAREE